MTKPRTPERTRPELPRLVEQLRILLWIQMHLTLIGLLIVLVWAGYVTNVRHLRLSSETTDQLLLTMAMRAAAAAVLALCAKLLWRGGAGVYLLILVAEAIVVATMVRAVASGFIVGILLALSAVLTVWVLANLLRREVRAFLFRRGDQV